MIIYIYINVQLRKWEMLNTIRFEDRKRETLSRELLLYIIFFDTFKNISILLCIFFHCKDFTDKNAFRLKFYIIPHTHTHIYIYIYIYIYIIFLKFTWQKWKCQMYRRKKIICIGHTETELKIKHNNHMISPIHEEITKITQLYQNIFGRKGRIEKISQ